MASPDLRNLIEAARTAPVMPDAAARALALIDLTSLRGGETADEIEHLVPAAVGIGTAAICIYAAAVPLARPLLEGAPVRLATVANFPQAATISRRPPKRPPPRRGRGRRGRRRRTHRRPARRRCAAWWASWSRPAAPLRPRHHAQADPGTGACASRADHRRGACRGMAASTF